VAAAAALSASTLCALLTPPPPRACACCPPHPAGRYRNLTKVARFGPRRESLVSSLTHSERSDGARLAGMVKTAVSANQSQVDLRALTDSDRGGSGGEGTTPRQLPNPLAKAGSGSSRRKKRRDSASGMVALARQLRQQSRQSGLGREGSSKEKGSKKKRQELVRVCVGVGVSVCVVWVHAWGLWRRWVTRCDAKHVPLLWCRAVHPDWQRVVRVPTQELAASAMCCVCAAPLVRQHCAGPHPRVKHPARHGHPTARPAFHVLCRVVVG